MAVGAYAALAGRYFAVGASLGAAAALLLGLGLVLRWPATVPWSVLTVALGYVVARGGREAVDGWAAAVGAALLLAAELAYWSIDHDARIQAEPALATRRALTRGALLSVSLVVDVLLLGTAAIAASAGVLLAAVGVAAAVASVAVVLRLVRA